MGYTVEQLDEIAELYRSFTESNQANKAQTTTLLENLKNDKAKEYLAHGFLRRLNIISTCIGNIFRIFPPERKLLLQREDIDNITIFLHTLTINLSGALDNLAWVFVLEKGFYTQEKSKKSARKVTRHEIGLFKHKTKNLLPKNITHLLESEDVKIWKEKYLTPFRDSLAHRIPIYLPSKVLYEEDKNQLKIIEGKINSLDLNDIEDVKKHKELTLEKNDVGSICYSIYGSFSETDFGILFHAQILKDFKMLDEISLQLIKELNNS